MIRLIAMDIPDNLAPIADELLERLRNELTERTEVTATIAVSQLTNKGLVAALQARCLKVGRTIQVADVVAVADIDQAEFFKWQRGASIGRKTRSKCERTVSLSAKDFLCQFDSLPQKLADLQTNLSSR